VAKQAQSAGSKRGQGRERGRQGYCGGGKDEAEKRDWNKERESGSISAGRRNKTKAGRNKGSGAGKTGA